MGMGEKHLREVIASAIEPLASKDFITNVVKKLQVELEVFIQKQVSDATEPLKQRLYLVEQILCMYEEKLEDFKKRMEELDNGKGNTIQNHVLRSDKGNVSNSDESQYGRGDMIMDDELHNGPGSGRSNLQKKYSMKTTILHGTSGQTTADGGSRVQVDVNRSNVQKPTSLKQRTDKNHHTSDGTHISNGDTRPHSRPTSGKKSKHSTKSSHENSGSHKERSTHRELPSVNAHVAKKPETRKNYQITDL